MAFGLTRHVLAPALESGGQGESLLLQRLWLHCLDGNSWATSLYLSQGFHLCDFLPRYYKIRDVYYDANVLSIAAPHHDRPHQPPPPRDAGRSVGGAIDAADQGRGLNFFSPPTVRRSLDVPPLYRAHTFATEPDTDDSPMPDYDYEAEGGHGVPMDVVLVLISVLAAALVSTVVLVWISRQ